MKARAALLIAAASLGAAGCSPGDKTDQASAAPAAAAVDARRIEQGRRLLAQYQCGSCHQIPGVEGAAGQVAGSLDQFGRRSYIAGRLANRPELLQQWIVAPQSLVPGTAMPAMGVSPGEARDMAAYLGSLQ